eukprot:ANDGO_06467.mRNA.1 Protein white
MSDGMQRGSEVVSETGNVDTSQEPDDIEIEVIENYVPRPVKEPMGIFWEDLSYSVEFKDPKTKKVASKQILRSVSGCALPGELLFIMGGSGAGKSTLLNAVAWRLLNGTLKGTLKVNDYPEEKYADIVKNHSAYVLQADIMLETLTPREVLSFQAELKMQDLALVEDVLHALDLGKCEDTLISKISGGQKKRVSIAMELLANPALLLLDEPTSGLDSFTAVKLIQLLKKMAVLDNRTIICTIHQPSSDIFALFDKLLLLDEGGVVYFGKAQEVIPYFDSIGYPTPAYSNPADHFISVTKTRDSRKLVSLYAQSDYAVNAQKSMILVPKNEGFALTKPLGQVNILAQALILTRRQFTASRREPMVTTAKLAQTIFLSIIAGLIYLGLGTNQQSIQDRTGALFFLCTNAGFSAITGVVFVFPKEKRVFLKEQRSNLYSTLMYYIAKVLSDLPFQVSLSLLFSTIVYFMIGFQVNAAKFFIFAAAMQMLTQVSAAMGYIISAAAPNGDIASALIPAVMIPSMLFGGLFINLNSIPYYFYPFAYISLIRYGYEIVSRNEYEGLSLHCSTGETVNGICPVTNGSQVLSQQDLEFDIYQSFLVLLGLYFSARILAYYILNLAANGIRGNGPRRVSKAA